MQIKNDAVFDDKGVMTAYVIPKGKNISEFIKGKTIIRPAHFATGKNINQIKGHEIVSITKGKDNISIRYVKDEILLKSHLGVTKEEIDGILKKHNLVFAGDEYLSKIGYIKAKIPDGRDVIEVIKEIRNEYKVKTPEPNYIGEILTISDPLYGNQWYVPDTKFDRAWEVTKNKKSVKVAVIDTGVKAEHRDLKDRIMQGHDFVNNDSDASDDNGHGTFVSGIIAATANDIGIKGLYYYAQIIPVKVIDVNGIGTYEDTAKGIIYAVDNGAKVINLSIGGYGYSFILQDAVDYALEKGCIVVAAGGNDGIEHEIYPAAYPDVIGVSALGNNGQIWSSSNSGRHIDVSAPGANILSTGLNNDYVYATGTSASAPMVSALAAMLASERSELSSSVIERLIMQAAKDLGENGRDRIYGSGEIDALASLGQEVKSFHDVALRSVHIEPMVFEKGKPTYIIANIENAGTFKSEKFDVVLYEIVGEEKKEFGRKEGIEVIDKTKVIFEWKPEGSKENVKLEISVLSEADTNNSNNSRTSTLTLHKTLIKRHI
jgi:subtilisin family serine protease